MLRKDEAPLFIVGAVRSGTTLFRLMLGHHPEVCIFGEFEEAVRLMERDSWPDLETYRRFLSTDRAFGQHGFAIDPSLSYLELVRSFFAQACAQTDRAIVGAAIHSHFDRCPDIWPHARYVHVLRDPRDVARSCVAMGWFGTVQHGCRVWQDAEQRWDRLRRRIRPEQQHEIRYEDLVRRPEPVLTDVCHFLGIAYNSAMLKYPETTTYAAPDPRLAEQWRKRLTRSELQHIEYRCGRLMEARGYELSGYEPSRPTPVERFYLGVQNTFGRVRFSVRRYGAPLWVARQATRFGPWKLKKRVRLRMNQVDMKHLK